ncbi:hypothetical protein HHL24_17090 [Paraburkholderia sp. RP-4-7]|uniref:Uncharacterized protein n=1 Tax=Paraburkholderia polaris TaxID=2728848 RepID=A0A848IIE5_9BURK|nr:hypothetical protein [Paraburkholderia polaris]NML99644.1 hypothetical protein [Paraburkholderia polaris]
MSAAIEGGIFRDAREALVFALNYQCDQYATSALARLAQEGAIGSGRGLVGLDGAAQAGMVKSRLQWMSDHSVAALIARCVPHQVKCDGGGTAGAQLKDSAVWLAAIDEVRRFIETTQAHAVVVDVVVVAAIRKFFGERKTVQEIADHARMHRVTANRQILLIKAELERLEVEAWAELDSSLRAAGMIQ